MLLGPVRAFWTPRARAQTLEVPSTAPSPFGASGQVALSTEHLAAFTVTIAKSAQDLPANLPMGTTGSGSQCSSTTASLSFFSTVLSEGCSGFGLGLNLVRWGADVFVSRGVSLGGSFAYSSSSFDNESAAATGGSTATSIGRSENSFTTFTLAPRVGYAHPLSATWALWPHLGIGYTNSAGETTSTATSDQGIVTVLHSPNKSNAVTAELDMKLVITPVSHFSLVWGPFVTIPISNRIRGQGSDGLLTERRTKTYSFGVALGALAYF